MNTDGYGSTTQINRPGKPLEMPRKGAPLPPGKGNGRQGTDRIKYSSHCHSTPAGPLPGAGGLAWKFPDPLVSVFIRGYISPAP